MNYRYKERNTRNKHLQPKPKKTENIMLRRHNEAQVRVISETCAAPFAPPLQILYNVKTGFEVGTDANIIYELFKI